MKLSPLKKQNTKIPHSDGNTADSIMQTIEVEATAENNALTNLEISLTQAPPTGTKKKGKRILKGNEFFFLTGTLWATKQREN